MHTKGNGTEIEQFTVAVKVKITGGDLFLQFTKADTDNECVNMYEVLQECHFAS